MTTTKKETPQKEEKEVTVATAKKKDSKKDSMPSFFIEENDEIVIKVDILFNKESGRLTSVSRAGILNPEDYSTEGHCEESFTFKPVDYDQITKYRQRCTTYRRDAGKSLVDPVQLRNYLLVWHLKDWTIRDAKGKKVKLTFSDAGGLDDDSIAKVYNINPTMLDVVLTLFEKDMMM